LRQVFLLDLYDYIMKHEPRGAYLWSDFEPGSLVTSGTALSHTNPTFEATSRAQDNNKTNALYMVAISTLSTLWERSGERSMYSKRLAAGCTVRGSNPGRGEIFRTLPDEPWDQHNGYRVFLGVKTSEAWCSLPPQSSAEVEETVELYLCSPSRLSWPVPGWTLTFTLPLASLSFWGLIDVGWFNDNKTFWKLNLLPVSDTSGYLAVLSHKGENRTTHGVTVSRSNQTH
jgi:hypothetical protein